MKKVQKEAKEESLKHEKIVHTHVQKIQELQEIKIKKSSEEKEFKKKQKCLDKKLKNIQNEKPKGKVKDKEEEMAGADQNQNKITQEESIHIPAVPVANVFGILDEEELCEEE